MSLGLGHCEYAEEVIPCVREETRHGDMLDMNIVHDGSNIPVANKALRVENNQEMADAVTRHPHCMQIIHIMHALLVDVVGGGWVGVDCM